MCIMLVSLSHFHGICHFLPHPTSILFFYYIDVYHVRTQRSSVSYAMLMRPNKAEKSSSHGQLVYFHNNNVFFPSTVISLMHMFVASKYPFVALTLSFLAISHNHTIFSSLVIDNMETQSYSGLNFRTAPYFIMHAGHC